MDPQVLELMQEVTLPSHLSVSSHPQIKPLEGGERITPNTEKGICLYGVNVIYHFDVETSLFHSQRDP